MTTDIRHHLTDDLLMAYSAGTLPEAFSLVVATHVSMCDECRARLAGFDAVGGSVVETMDMAEMGEDAFGATLALIAANADEEPEAPGPARTGLFPAPLRDWVGGDLDAVAWKGVGGGVSQATIPTRGGETLRLLRIPGGTAVPDHGHGGTELTLVLQGAFRDESDRFGAGDVECADEDMVHTPVAEPGPDCICLAATDSRLRFTRLLPRIAGRIMGI